jgi:outer membrane protein assembly factor BamB
VFLPIWTTVFLVAQAVPPAAASQFFPSEVKWTVEVSAKPVGAPVSSGDRLFVPLESGVSARRLTDGGELWNAKVEIAGALAAAPEHVIVPGKAELRALVASTGEVAWTIPTSGLTAPPTVHGDLLFVAMGEELTALKVADGSKVWSQNVGLVEERPVVDGTRVYVPASDGRLIALMLQSGEAIWEFDAGIKPTEPLIFQDRVYVGSAAKRFCSIDARNGQEVWCFGIGAGIVGKAAADESHVYFVALDNLLRAHDRRNGSIKWKNDLKYRPSSGPSLVGSTVCAPGASTRVLQAFETQTGSAGPQLTLADELVQVPLFVTSDERPTTLAAVSGNLKNVWKLTLAVQPPPPPPKLRIGPVTVLPGQVVPRGSLQVPRGLSSRGVERLPRFAPATAPKTTGG